MNDQNLNFRGENWSRKWWHTISFFLFFATITIGLFICLNRYIHRLTVIHKDMSCLQQDSYLIDMKKKQIDRYLTPEVQKTSLCKNLEGKSFGLKQRPEDFLNSFFSQIEKTNQFGAIKYKIDRKNLIEEKLKLCHVGCSIETLSSNDNVIYGLIERIKAEFPGYLIIHFFHLRKIQDPLFPNRTIINGLLQFNWFIKVL